MTVSKAARDLTVTDGGGQTIFYAPVTTGSEHDPLPIGEWKVNGVQFNPTFNYNPDLFWDADPRTPRRRFPPGPNNPVGVVWIDISQGRTTASTARRSRRRSAARNHTAASA